MFLSHFNPAHVEPGYLVDRDADVAWLREALDSFLGHADAPGRAVCVLGEKGVGKSIVTRKVLADLREVHSATTVFITVDCRRHRDQRGVYQAIARELVNELTTRTELSNALLDNARLLETLAGFDEGERRILHERIVQHQAALTLKEPALVRFLARLDISLRRSEESRASLLGRIRIDPHRLQEAVIESFHDLRAAKLDVVLYLDNIDELDHDAIRDEQSRVRVRGETDGLLGLVHAPIALVLNMRTYFSSMLGREIGLIRQIERLAVADQIALLDKRIARERPDTRKRLAEPAARTCLEAVAKLAPTPLAALTWFHYLCQTDQHGTRDLKQALDGLLRLRYSVISSAQIRKIAELFRTRELVDRDTLLRACDDNVGTLNQLLMTQAVLPLDWWHPTDFRLDPELYFAIAEG